MSNEEFDVIVIYDVHEEFREVRDELKEVLKDYGARRLQYSVYYLRLTRRQLSRLIREIRRVIRRSKARVDIVLPCAKCFRELKCHEPL